MLKRESDLNDTRSNITFHVLDKKGINNFIHVKIS